jgi:hypothetical protein
MGAGYRAALADPELLSLREEAALLTTRIMWLLNRLKDTPPGPAYEAAWTELRQVIQDKAKVTAAEVRRLIKLQGVVTVEQALLFARALLTAAGEVVTDPDQLRRLQHRCLRLLPPDEYSTGRVNGDGNGDGHGHDAGLGPSSPADGAPAPPSTPGGGESTAAGARGQVEAAAADRLPCGLKERPSLPPGADPDEWEWVQDEEDDDGVA